MRPGNTFFHGADAKGKLAGLCLVIAAVIVSKGLIGCIAAAAAALTVSYLAGISLPGADKTTKRDVSVFSSDLFDECVFLQRGALHLELVDFSAEPGGNPAGGDGGRSPDIDFSFRMVLTITTEPMEITHGLEELLSPPFEGRCSDGRNLR